MTDPVDFENKLGLAEFLADLRAELTHSAEQAQDQKLKFEMKEVTVALDIGVTIEKKGEMGAKVGAKFWVFGKAEAEVKAGVSSEHVTTQRLTLTLTPWMEDTTVDETGTVHKAKKAADIESVTGSHEDGF